jgi:hypothetical protein
VFADVIDDTVPVSEFAVATATMFAPRAMLMRAEAREIAT